VDLMGKTDEIGGFVGVEEDCGVSGEAVKLEMLAGLLMFLPQGCVIER